MFNASTIDGSDRTVDYIRGLNPNFGILNLIASTASNPDKLTAKDLVLIQLILKSFIKSLIKLRYQFGLDGES